MAKIDDIYGAADDYGLVTSAEARALGVSDAEVVQYAARGRLERVARGVYRVPVWPYQEEAPYALAVRAAGEGSYLYDNFLHKPLTFGVIEFPSVLL